MLQDRFPFTRVVAFIPCIMALMCAPPIAYPQETPVHFADSALKAAVEGELGITDPTPMHMKSLRSLSAQGLGINDLTGLEYATNLRTLWLRNNRLADLSPLEGLVKLEDLLLAQNLITDLSPLADLTNLARLLLYENRISDLSPLARLTALADLDLSQNRIKGIVPLADLRSLVRLQLSTNEINDVSPLHGLRNLRKLSLNRNDIIGLSALAGLTQLEDLSISQNAIVDISPLADLTQLQSLGLSLNPISDIRPLAGLTSLRTLYAGSCQIEDITALGGLTNLESLDIGYNTRIADLGPVSGLRQLKLLHVQRSQVVDISGAGSLVNLEDLRLGYNQIVDCSALTGLINLTWLSLPDNQIHDLDALRALARVERLYLQGNLISDIGPLSDLKNLTVLDISSNSLNCDAYCVHIPTIRNNNPVVDLSFDPQPTWCVCPPATDRVLFVDRNAGGRGDGSSWTHAFRHLQDALQAAKYGDEIRVAQGVYRPDQGTEVRAGDRYESFQLKNGVAVKGGYAGVVQTDPNARDIGAFRAVLSGDLREDDKGDCGDPSMNDNSVHVVTADYTDKTAILEGFTITGGMANAGSQWGGGLLIEHAGSPSIRSCTFICNYAGSSGGGLCDAGAGAEAFDLGLVLTDCVFTGNHAGLIGGAMKVCSYCTLESCQVANNSAGVGGGGISANDNLKLVECAFEDNHVGNASGSAAVEHWGNRSKTSRYNPLSMPDMILDAVTILTKGPEAAMVGDAHIVLASDVDLRCGRFSIVSSLIDGTGRLNLGKDAGLRFAGRWQYKPETIVRTSISGPGQIEIDAGQRLIVEGNAIVNLSSSSDGLPDPERDGRMVVNGSLVVRGSATIENTNIDVKLLEVDDPNTIQYNNITLLEASTGFGGEFFVGENARIRYNNIVSEGDRYLDLDPDPVDGKHPSIENNCITVVIKEGKLSRQGTLLELRARDYDAGAVVNPLGNSGAYPVAATSPGFTEDPSENWVLEKLALEPHAKLNLTNRQGFRYQGPDEPYLETVYVKDLVMGPNSVLNTALQTMYYQRLVDPNGTELARDPTDPFAPLANGARFTDIPVLGFSLGIIAMDDQMEFDIRVRKRLTDPADDSKQPSAPAAPLYIGSIERIDSSTNPDVPPSVGGVMEIRTQAPDKQPATSVAAKGAFARAGDEDITIELEYLFLDDPYGEAEIVVYLSDHPEVSQNHHGPYEVARIYPPGAGRPGSISSSRFGVFSGTFSRRDLNFTRGTYVELELRGRGVRCWIDNWDPRVSCYTCCDFDDVGFVDITDYYLLLAEFGRINPGSSDTGKGCLDLDSDGCIAVSDLLRWEVMGPLNACPPGYGPAYAQDEATTTGLQIASMPQQATVQLGSLGSVAILGKSDGINADGQRPQSVLLSPDGSMMPSEVSGTGRLVTDSRGHIYQIDPAEGIKRVENETVVVRPQEGKTCGNRLVSVGFNGGRGVPIMDAAFDPVDPDVVYVVPVQVTVADSASQYVAAARLRLASSGDYVVEELYGTDPSGTSTSTITDSSAALSFLHEPDLQHLQEVEIDAAGRNLFVLSSCWHNHNNWVIVYDTEGPDPQGTKIWLNEPNTGSAGLVGPSAMVVSAVHDSLYLVSSAQDSTAQDDLAREIYCFHVAKENEQVTGLTFDHTITVYCPVPQSRICDLYPRLCEQGQSTATLTSLAEDPVSGTLYAVGFSAPKFKEDAQWPAFGMTLYTTPLLATVHSEESTAEAIELEDESLLLPLSVTYSGNTIRGEAGDTMYR